MVQRLCARAFRGVQRTEEERDGEHRASKRATMRRRRCQFHETFTRRVCDARELRHDEWTVRWLLATYASDQASNGNTHLILDFARAF